MKQKNIKDRPDPKKQAQDESLIVEIEESITQERIEKLWKDYGAYLIGAAALIILATASISGWSSYTNKKNISQTTILLTAMDQEDQAKAIADTLPLLEGGIKSLATLTAAGLLIEDENNIAALGLYNEAILNESFTPVFQDLAALMDVRLKWEQSDNSSDKLLARLSTIWEKETSPWRWHARLQAALILAHDNKDYKNAREHLTRIFKGNDVPQSLTEKARALDHIYSLREQMSQSETTPGTNKEKNDGEQQG